ncbi:MULTISPECIES: c-type cytochrome [Sulfurimonas]|uniref:c-type cytochrome n=1 Tax=Sulfurimonas TaxID=202746 RepID=UPI001264583D|nr:c-type cytochrome [Sulfurimonas indica]
MKNIIVGILTLIIFGLMAWTAMHGGAYNGGEHGKVIADLGNRTAAQTVTAVEEKSDREKEAEELSALREKAGNIGGFKVSDAYKSKCASCHGVDGSGMQYGKKLMGPKLFGQSADMLYKKLDDFKSGRKENMVMKGLLLHMSKDDLRKFADEIGEFPARAEALKNEQ